jgi:cytochrome P450
MVVTTLSESDVPEPELEFPMARDERCPFDPPPALARLQQDCPVSRVHIWSGDTPWLVSRYSDARLVLTDERISADTDLTGYPQPTSGVAGRRTKFKPFMNMDDPAHAAQRQLLNPSFMVKKMEAMRPRIQRFADELIDALLAGPQPADLVQAYALPIPTFAICELLGVPYEDRSFFQDTSNVFFARESSAEMSLAAAEDLTSYLADLTEKKNASPADDVLSHLAMGPLRAGTMSLAEIATLAQFLVIAGHETTANMIALGTIALLAHPEQLDQVRNAVDPSVVEGAVEELLRYLTVPHAGRRRVAKVDMEIGGQHIRAGDGIIAALDIANRDGSQFPNPNQLDIGRSARRHLAFGFGVHQCLGQQLARIELQVAYATLSRRIPTLQVRGAVEDLPYKHDMLIYGVHALPVTW